MQISNTKVMPVGVDVLWDLTIDLDALPQISPTFSSIEALDPGLVQVGSRYRLKQPNQPSKIWTITAIEPLERFEWQTSATGLTITATHILTPLPGDQSRNELRVNLSGWASGLLGRFLRKPIGRALQTENDGFYKAAKSR
ncbi:MAG: SRPBCC family protein [Acidimicrobiia bacterium]|nr:SRPBCC family protein [Acidimicrobiia bacterium]